MNETESSTAEQQTDEYEVRQRPWRSVGSAPWLFTLALVIIQFLTFPSVWIVVGRNPIAYVFIAANLSLAAIVPIWCVVIRRWVFVVLGIVVLLANGAMMMSIGPPRDLMIFLLPSLVASTVAIPLLGISCFLGRFGKPLDGGETVLFQEGLRFGIVHLFVASTIVAVICVIGKALAPFLAFSPGDPLYLYAVVTIIISFNTLLSTWALMGRSIGLRLVIALLLSVFSCVVGSRVFPAATMILLMFGMCWMATTVHLALLRRCGLRFIKKQPNLEPGC